MKKHQVIATMMILGLMIFGFMSSPVFADPEGGYPDHNVNATGNSRIYTHWAWETDQPFIVNSELINSKDKLIGNADKIVELAKSYAKRDALLKVYGLRTTQGNLDTNEDAFLAGLKADNLTYLILTADSNATARKMAINDLKLLGCIIKNFRVETEFPYWAGLLENGAVPSEKIAHQYCHRMDNVGQFIGDSIGNEQRFFFWPGYMINDFTIANLCDNSAWMINDQKNLLGLYEIRDFWAEDRSSSKKFWEFNRYDLTLKENVDKAQKDLDAIKAKYMNRRTGLDY